LNVRAGIAAFGIRLKPLLRLASDYATAQVLTRVLAAISGLLLVRVLPVGEYGYYTLFLTAFTFICTFSDLGVTETLSYFRWRAGKRHRPWLPYMHAVLSLRRIVFVFGSLAGGAYLLYVTQRVGKSGPEAILAAALMAVAAWFAIHSAIVAYTLKLQQHFRRAYAVEICNEACKVAVVMVIWIAGLASAFAGMLSVVLGAVASATLARRLFGGNVSPAPIAGSHQARRRRMLLRQVAPVLPGTIHFTLQGPLIAWLAAYYGSIENLAEVGALGRLAMIIGLIAGFTSTVFIPRLISITDEALFRRRYFHWWGVIIGYGALTMLAVLAFPRALLWLLGNSYHELSIELLIASATAVVGTWGAYSWNVNRARGWTRHQPYRVPVMVLGQVGLYFALDLSTTQGVLLFSFWSMALDVCFQTLISFAGLFAAATKVKEAPNAP
jgi:O-antigen/teichoic acid export membrane protein